jgi:hypothetical protein
MLFQSRFWRKTRSTNSSPLSLRCPGVDGNRNYDFFWNTAGTSGVCGETYAGNMAFSEAETRVVRDILNEHLGRMALYLTMHSYSSMVLYPWGHNGTDSYNVVDLRAVGTAIVDAIETVARPDFPRYSVDNAATIGYLAAGTSADYAHSLGVALSFVIELPGLSTGQQGFNLPPQYIEQVCRETWEGIVAGARSAGDLFVS